MKYNLNLDLGVDKIYVINLKKHKERKKGHDSNVC